MVENSPRMLAGRYQLGDMIGRGGMAEVHIGRDTRLGRTVAIKVLRSDLARDPTFQARFRREAQAAAGLNHPSIVAVYDTGEDISTDPVTGEQTHLPFIVMEYVEGHTVRELVRDGSALPIDEAVEITAGVLSALQYAHQAGIVHRDVKPANVMITTTGQVKVMDFGIARALADSAATMTQTQAVIGTAQYLSPEQARGETVDTRSDLYSTGCLLYELLTGRTPFVGDSAVAVAYQHVREEPAPPSAYAPDVPEVLDRITLKALAKERDQRYQSAAEFRADLEAAMTGGQVMAPAAGLLTAPTQLMQPTAQTQVIGATSPTPGAFAPVPVPVQNTSTQLLTEPDDDDTGMSTGRKVLIGVLIVLGIAVVAFILWNVLNPANNTPPPANTPTTTAPQKVAVPEVARGMTGEDAESLLKQLNLVPVAAEATSADVPEGEVIRFDPKTGEQVDPQTEVTYYVSTGPDSIPVPEYRGWTIKDVRAHLEKIGLAVGTITPESSKEYPKDTVLDTDPPAKKKVKRGTEVNLTVSDGTVRVPNVVGKTLDEARQLLLDAGLSVGTVDKEESEEKANTVLEQSVASGNPVDRNSPVNLTVAKAIEPVKVPSVYGQTQQAAESAITAAQLVPEFVRELTKESQCDRKVADGTVCRMSPAPNTSKKPGSVVKIWTYTAPPPPTAQNTSPPATAQANNGQGNGGDDTEGGDEG